MFGTKHRSEREMRQEYKVAKTLMKSLKTELSADLPSIAALLQSKGRGKDTVLAHITPKEAALLKKRGGRGSQNPDTGLLEFDDGGTIETGAGFEGTPEQTAAAYNIQPTETPAFSGGAAPSTGGTQAAEQASFAAPPAYSPEFTPPAAPTPSPMGSFANIQGVPIAAGGLGTPGAGGISAAMGQYGIDYAQPAPTTEGPSAATQPGITATQPPKPAGGLNQLAKEQLGISGGQALGAGLSGLAGVLTARNAAAQGQQAKQELAAQAAPYQQQGKSLVSAAQAGQLSTASQQSYQAAQAQAAQAAARGGISGAGVVQTQAALENLRQNLLANDLNIGLQIQSIGDKIAQGAISAGVQADQYVNNLTSNYATNIARTLSGLGGTPQAPAAPTGV